MFVDDGHTSYTTKILRQLDASNLVKEVKKRNISIDVLYELNKEDFIRLGASEGQADYLVSTFVHTKQKAPLFTQPKSHSFTEILKQGHEQLSLLHTFLVYCRTKLQNKAINIIIDEDKNIHASNVFCDVSETICSQMQSIEYALEELKISTQITNTSKDAWKLQGSCRHLCIVASGISLAICSVLYIFKTKPNFAMFMKHW